MREFFNLLKGADSLDLIFGVIVPVLIIVIAKVTITEILETRF